MARPEKSLRRFAVQQKFITLDQLNSPAACCFAAECRVGALSAATDRNDVELRRILAAARSTKLLRR